jgi:hypothetical protein
MKSLLLAVAGLAAIASTPLQAKATLIPVVPVPGSVETDIHGINDDNIIVGTYFTPDDVAHGFFGTLDGQYTTFDYGNGSTATNAFEINDQGYVTGWAKAPGFQYGYAFIRNPDGSFVTIKRNGTPVDGFMNGVLTKKGEFVGSYWDAANSVLKGYYGKKGKYVRDLTLPFDTIWTAPRGSDDSETVIVGDYQLNENQQSGWLLKGGVVSTINYPDPNAATTLLWDINGKGLATGFWRDASRNFHPFMLDTRTSTFTQVDVHGAVFQQMLGINSAGFIAVDTDVGSFVYCPKARKKCPGNGTEISVKEGVHVAPGQFLNYDPRPAGR